MKKPTVFVVDDEVQICALLTRILQREGYAVRSFSDGQKALDALESDPPDLLVTDLMMPGMSGLELARKSRMALPDIITVLTTGYASIDNVVDALRSGVNDFVTKPFSVAEIRGVVSRALEAGRAAPVARRSPPAVPELQVANAALARRFRDMSLIESIHGILAEEPSSWDLLQRAEPAITAALGVHRAALLVPGGIDGTFQVKSATVSPGPWETPDDVDSTVLTLIVAAGIGSAIDSDALGPAACLLDSAALAAAPLVPRDPRSEDAGVLVVSRVAQAARFDAEDLRVLGVVAAAMGDVYRAIRTSERTEDAYVESLCDVVEATEARSPWFARHSERVRELSVALGQRLGLAAVDLEVLDKAARLLDLGRVETPDDLLDKVGRPNPDEWRALRHHCVLADELVRPLGRLRDVKPIIRHHHENWDGTGYPDGLRGDEIPYLASLVRITDSFAALTSARAWRPAVEPASAVRQIVEMSGRHFHPQLVAAFTEMQFASPSRVGDEATARDVTA